MCEIYCAESWPLCVCRIIHAIVWENALCNWLGIWGALCFSLTLTQTLITTLYCHRFLIPTWHGAVQVKQVSSLFYSSILKSVKGKSNMELVENLKQAGIITKQRVVDAMNKIDR